MSDPHPDFFDPPFDVEVEPDVEEDDAPDAEEIRAADAHLAAQRFEAMVDYGRAVEDAVYPHYVPGTNIVAGTRHDPNL